MDVEPLRKTQSIDGLQYLRGIAALMVVFFHARSYFGDVPEWTRVGSRGVDIFFVISGFIMAYSTRRMGDEVSAAKAGLIFLSKRFIRVAPLYWIALLWTTSPYWINWLSTSGSLHGLYQNLSADLISIAKDFAFVPHLSIDEDEPGEIFPALIQGWTLNYEIFFYLLFGLSMLFRKYRLVATSLAIVALVVLGKAYHFSNVVAQFYTSSILIEFVFGMIVFEAYSKTHQLRFNRTTLLLLGTIGVLLLNSGSSVNDKLVLAAGSAIIVWVFIQAFRGVHVGPLKLLGDASYSIYLFHLATFKITREVITCLGLSPSGYFNIITILLMHALVSIVAGIVIYYVIEKPLLKTLRNMLGSVVSIWKRSKLS
jgi:exopolysaccharide production protein ExoZ